METDLKFERLTVHQNHVSVSILFFLDWFSDQKKAVYKGNHVLYTEIFNLIYSSLLAAVDLIVHWVFGF